MITITSAKSNNFKKQLNGNRESDSDSEDDESLSEDEDDDCTEMVENGIESQAVNPSMKLLRTWNNFSPPTQESEVIGKWYVGMWETKKSKNTVLG